MFVLKKNETIVANLGVNKLLKLFIYLCTYFYTSFVTANPNQSRSVICDFDCLTELQNICNSQATYEVKLYKLRLLLGVCGEGGRDLIHPYPFQIFFSVKL